MEKCKKNRENGEAGWRSADVAVSQLGLGASSAGGWQPLSSGLGSAWPAKTL